MSRWSGYEGKSEQTNITGQAADRERIKTLVGLLCDLKPGIVGMRHLAYEQTHYDKLLERIDAQIEQGVGDD